jgi:hypothetical protein
MAGRHNKPRRHYLFLYLFLPRLVLPSSHGFVSFRERGTCHHERVTEPEAGNRKDRSLLLEQHGGWVGPFACSESRRSVRHAGGSSMGKRLMFRVASTAGLLVLALLFVGLAPFLSAGASPTGPISPISVDRSLKTDRLPVSHEAVVLPDWRYEFSAFNPQVRAQSPFACDAAFSTISSRAAANFFGRCLA